MRVICVTSGKGGVGKTTTTASIGAALAMMGHKTAIIDFDIGARNLDSAVGCERRVIYDIIQLIENREINLHKALIKTPGVENLYLLAASQTRDKDDLDREGVRAILNDFRDAQFDFVICDSPAGIENGAKAAMYFADEALIVVQPEVYSIQDADRIIGMLDSETMASEESRAIPHHLLVTRYDLDRVESGEMLSLTQIKDILGVDILGVIPDSKFVLAASNAGRPAVLQSGTVVASSYMRAARSLLGEQIDIVPEREIREGFMAKLFGKFKK